MIAETAEPSRTGIATALYNNVKTLGGGDTPRESAYVLVWVVCAVLCLTAALIAARTPAGASRL